MQFECVHDFQLTKCASIGLSKIGVWVGQEERRSTAKPLRLCSRVRAGRTERQRYPQRIRARLYTGVCACMAPRPTAAAMAFRLCYSTAAGAGVGAAAGAGAGVGGAAYHHFIRLSLLYLIIIILTYHYHLSFQVVPEPNTQWCAAPLAGWGGRCSCDTARRLHAPVRRARDTN
eukprot:COSAG06_NODE_9537_length_1875_cov_4.125000_1_plen_174_part_00